MLSDFFNWQNSKEITVALAFLSLLIVWVQTAFSLAFLFPLRVVAGLFLAIFPIGFLFLSIFFQEEQAMSKPEWLVYSIALSIVFFSFGIVAVSFLFGEKNTIWLALRIVLLFTVLFFLIARTRQYFSKVN